MAASSTSQPNGTGTNPGPTPTASPQPKSTRLNDPGTVVTDGGTLPFAPPPARPGVGQQGPGKPFNVKAG